MGGSRLPDIVLFGLMGYIYDATHSYQRGFVYILIGLLIAADGMLWLYYEPVLTQANQHRTLDTLDEPAESVVS